jgi:hypothetical protein
VTLIAIGCIKPLCDLLEVKDVKVLTVALEGLENILRIGEQEKQGEFNDVATLIDEVDGVTKIQELQYHTNEGNFWYRIFICVLLISLICRRNLCEVSKDSGNLLPWGGRC